MESDVALVIYSSGTTGKSKGVLLSQRALVAALLAGATHTFFVSPVIATFLAAGEAAIAALSRLRYLGYGAAPMPLPLLRRALDALPQVKFVQVYGQTEVAGVATTWTPENTVGRTRTAYCSRRAGPYPAYCRASPTSSPARRFRSARRGETWLHADQRMTGYLNRPDATAETITDGWVHTGDIGRVDAEGYVYVEDRLEDMIISGGENVYGPEVERVLLADPVDIQRFCRRQLAGYKCPGQIRFVEELPRNASGKILKRELRQPYWADRDRKI